MNMAKHSMAAAAQRIGVHKMTLYRWEKSGKIRPAKRLARTNERVFTDEDIEQIIRWKELVIDPAEADAIDAA
jgi:DNA-binding transcriptional MerR regulator